MRIESLVFSCIALASAATAQQTVPPVDSFDFVNTPSGFVYSVSVVSNDGTVGFGTYLSSTAPNYQAFRWTKSGGFVSLGAGVGTQVARIRGCDATGSLMVGEYFTGAPTRPFYWTAATGQVGFATQDRMMTGLSGVFGVSCGEDTNVGGGGLLQQLPTGPTVPMPLLPTGTVTHPLGVSANARFIVGECATAAVPNGEAFLFDLFMNLMIPLGAPPAPISFRDSVANDVSDLGVPVGRWTIIDTFGVARDRAVVFGAPALQLDVLPGFGHGTATAISSNGNIVIGECTNGGVTRSFVYDRRKPQQGVVEANAFFGGLVPSGWSITALTDVSGDGQVFAGGTTGPGGQTRGFMARREN